MNNFREFLFAALLKLYEGSRVPDSWVQFPRISIRGFIEAHKLSLNPILVLIHFREFLFAALLKQHQSPYFWRRLSAISANFYSRLYWSRSRLLLARRRSIYFREFLFAALLKRPPMGSMIFQNKTISANFYSRLYWSVKKWAIDEGILEISANFYSRLYWSTHGFWEQHPDCGISANFYSRLYWSFIFANSWRAKIQFPRMSIRGFIEARRRPRQ